MATTTNNMVEQSVLINSHMFETIYIPENEESDSSFSDLDNDCDEPKAN